MNEKLRVYIRICRVFLYELAAWSYIVSHQHGEDIIYVGGIVDCYLFQNTRFRVHCCFPQLFGIHLTQTFVSLCMDSVFLSVTIFLNECLIAAAVREKDNFDEVTVTAKVARKDADGKRVKEVVDGKKVTVYDEVEKKIKKDQPSRLHARREMLKVLYTVKTNDGTKKGAKEVDLVAKLFDEIAPKYADRNGGYTRIVKIGQRKGDGALEVLLELV